MVDRFKNLVPKEIQTCAIRRTGRNRSDGYVESTYRIGVFRETVKHFMCEAISGQNDDSIKIERKLSSDLLRVFRVVRVWSKRVVNEGSSRPLQLTSNINSTPCSFQDRLYNLSEGCGSLSRPRPRVDEYFHFALWFYT